MMWLYSTGNLPTAMASPFRRLSFSRYGAGPSLAPFRARPQSIACAFIAPSPAIPSSRRCRRRPASFPRGPARIAPQAPVHGPGGTGSVFRHHLEAVGLIEGDVVLRGGFQERGSPRGVQLVDL